MAVGKSYNFSDSKEKVRMMYYFDLIEKYKYPADRIEFEISVSDKMPDKYASIIVFTNDKQRKPYIAVECKGADISNEEFKKAVEEAIASARLLKAKFAVCVAGDKYRVIKIDELNNRAEVGDIPVYYGEDSK